MNRSPILALTLLGLLTFAGPAMAGQATEPVAIPFRGTLNGLHVSRTPLTSPFVFDRFEVDGQATHLGQFDLVIEATVNFGSRPVTGVGSYTFIAANGDRLVATHTGSSSLLAPGIVLITEHATVDPTQSTGRFEGASGTFTTERHADAATGVGGVTEGSFEGAITFGS